MEFIDLDRIDGISRVYIPLEKVCLRIRDGCYNVPHETAMLTQRTKYAFKALLHLSRSPGIVPVGVIAEAEDIPRKFLEQVLLDLRRAGLVHSRPGKGGGHSLARPAQDIPLIAVIRAIEGPAAPLACLSQTAYVRCHDCRDEAACRVRRLFGHVYAATYERLASTSLADADSLRHD